MLGHRSMNVNDYLQIIRRRIWQYPYCRAHQGRTSGARMASPKNRYTATTTVLVRMQLSPCPGWKTTNVWRRFNSRSKHQPIASDHR